MGSSSDVTITRTVPTSPFPAPNHVQNARLDRSCIDMGSGVGSWDAPTGSVITPRTTRNLVLWLGVLGKLCSGRGSTGPSSGVASSQEQGADSKGNANRREDNSAAIEDLLQCI